MLLQGAGDQPQTTDFVKDVTEADFMAEVVDRSMTVPVIVDFWAPWCGPCKTLGPQLEAEVAKAKGRVVMAKVNVDENQMIAQQLRVQSIPTVYAFFQGQPVDAFQGAIPQSQVKQFVDKLLVGRVEDAIDQLLEGFRRDRDWNDGAAKAQLITIFDAMGPGDPVAQKGRRRLSSLIFA